MSDADLWRLSARDLVRGYQARKFSPLKVTEAVIARIEAVNPRLNALVTVAVESALDVAKRATDRLAAGHWLGVLHGVPVSIKDVVQTRGIRTTWGSRIFADHVPDTDALVVERLKNAGAILLGKTNTPEFAAGAHTFNSLFGPTRNPWNPALSPGGSSGGSAVAVATGMGPLAHGSDLGGSLRTPAAFCGVFGFRGSPGLVPTHPTLLAWDTLAVHGPIARTVEDIALMLSVMAGPDDRDPISYDVDTDAFLKAVSQPSIEGWRIAWTPDLDGLVPVDPEIAKVAEEATEAFRSLGATVETASPDFTGFADIALGLRGVSMVATHADKLPKWKSEMQEGLVWNIEEGLRLGARDIARAHVARSELWHRVRRFMEGYELLVLPATAMRPFPVELPYPREIAGVPLANYTECFFIAYAISLTGLPVMSVPCGFTDDGLPVGLQIVGRRRREVDVLRAAAAFEAATPWSKSRPEIDHAIKPLSAAANPEPGPRGPSSVVQGDAKP